MEQVQQIAATLGLEPVLLAGAAILGWLLVIARGSLTWFGQPQTLAGSLIGGIGFAALRLTMPEQSGVLDRLGWQGVILQGFALAVACYLVSFVLGPVAEKFGLNHRMLNPPSKKTRGGAA